MSKSVFAGIIILALTTLPPPVVFADAAEMGSLPGDLNSDGGVDVLDVQRGINVALGVEAPAPEADLDDTGTVDVRDIQNLVNSALGVGGVFQRVTGVIDAPGGLPENLQVAALSNEGLVTQTEVFPDGAFELLLRTDTGWSMVILDSAENLAGWLAYAVKDTLSTALPLPPLSTGEVLDLGIIALEDQAIAGDPLLGIVGDVLPPIDGGDYNADEIPDYVEPILAPIMDRVTAILPALPEPGPGEPPYLETLENEIALCAQNNLDALLNPSLLDNNHNDIPDFLQPFFECLALSAAQWLSIIDWGELSGFVLMDLDLDDIPDIIVLVLYGIAGEIQAEITAGLNESGFPELLDENENKLPDDFEVHMVFPGMMGGADYPKPWEDSDGDHIPDWLDPDTQIAGDTDGDAIPDEVDWDADNDGIPNYADSTPLG